MQKKKTIGIIIFIVIIILIGYFSYKIYKTYHDNQKILEETDKIKTEVFINDTPISEPILPENEEEDPTPEPKLTLDFNKLKSINSDTIGWIKVSNTNIDYPIVKTTNNSYYLNHSFYKKSNINGWIFANYTNSSLFDDDNTVIFGHNTNVRTMFTELRDIYKGNLGTNIMVTIYLENDTINYKVFSIYLESPNNTTNLTKYLNDDIVSNMKEKSKLSFDANVNGDSKVLTLSTCNNVTNDRLILHAVKIS